MGQDIESFSGKSLATPALIFALLFLFILVPVQSHAQVEICNNGVDDDGDNFEDCDDEDCIGDPSCPVVATITVDNYYIFGYGDINGIDPSLFFGCFEADSAGSIFGNFGGNGTAQCGVLNVDNPAGPERFSLADNLDGRYVYLICYADASTLQGAAAQIGNINTSIASNILNGGTGPQWECYATGIETTTIDVDYCNPVAAGANFADVPNINSHIALANDYTFNGVQIGNTAALGGAASPGWVDVNGPIFTTPVDAGNGSRIAFDATPGNGSTASTSGYDFDIPVTGTPNTAGFPCNQFDNPDATWMWYNPDQNEDGSPDASNPFDGGPGVTPVGEYLIFRVGPLDVFFGSCSIENETIECESELPGVDYTVTFDVVNDTQFPVTQLVVPGQVGNSTISPNVITLPTAIPANGGVATGIQLNVSGGAAGDTLCIPVGLMAVGDDGVPFECCGTEVCVVLPDCCLQVSDESIFIDDSTGETMYTLAITNLPDQAPVIAEHLFINIISPPGAQFGQQWFPLNGLADNNGVSLLPTTVSGVSPGDQICFQITMHDATLNDCCGIVHYVDVPSPLTAPIPTFIRGDANSDGTFDLSDVINGLSYLFQSQSSTCLSALDSNDDETIDIADAIFSLDALFGGGPSPWPPHQNCGVDETAGSLGCEYFPACEISGSGPQGG